MHNYTWWETGDGEGRAGIVHWKEENSSKNRRKGKRKRVGRENDSEFWTGIKSDI
jgi:hypothetical protein